MGLHVHVSLISLFQGNFGVTGGDETYKYQLVQDLQAEERKKEEKKEKLAASKRKGKMLKPINLKKKAKDEAYWLQDFEGGTEKQDLTKILRL